MLLGSVGIAGVAASMISGRAQAIGFARIVPYSASKHAIIGITRSAAIEYGPQGVRINSISPGGVDTAMCRQAYIAPDQPVPPTVPNFQRRVNTVEGLSRLYGEKVAPDTKFSMFNA